MPKFITAIDHQLGQPTAQLRLQKFIDQITTQYADSISSMEGTWNENCLDFNLVTMGMQVTGSLEVTDDAVTIQGAMPLAMSMFRGRLEKTLEQELRKLLA